MRNASRLGRCFEHCRVHGQRASNVGLAIVTVGLLASGSATADSYWVCGDGLWTDGACWSATEGGPGGAGVPSGFTAYVTSNDALDRTIDMPTGTDGSSVSSLRIYGSGSGVPTLDHSDGLLSASSMSVGFDGSGMYTQRGGESMVVNGLSVDGYLPGATASFNLLGGTFTSGQHVTVGTYGQGSVVHSGGTLTAKARTGSSLSMAQYAGGEASYALNGSGQLETYDTYVGREGVADFVQSDGAHSATRYLTLGERAGGSGRYELKGGTLTVGSLERVGRVGSGHFIQDGGTHTAAMLVLADDVLFGSPAPTSSGTYELRNGVLETTTVQIGVRGDGLFSQTGGTHAVAGELWVGSSFALGSSAYELDAGSLSADVERIGYNGRYGTFDQRGGTNTTRHLIFAGHSDGWNQYQASGDDSGLPRYDLRNGILTLTEGRIFGQGRGVMNIDGGSLVLGGTAPNIDAMIRFNVGESAGSIGAFTLEAGQQLRSWDEAVGGHGAGTFIQAGGENTVDHELVIAAEAGSNGSYHLQGGTLRAWRIRNHGTFDYTGGTLVTTGGTFINGQAQAGGGPDPAATFNIENTTVSVLGDVVNYGTIMVTDADVDFTGGTVINHGGIVTDPSTLRFADLEIGADGFLVGGVGDVFVIEGNLRNASERGDAWDTANANLVFSGDGPHELAMPGTGDAQDFAWGRLELLDAASLVLSNGGMGVVVSELILGANSVFDLNGFDVFVETLVDNGGSYVGGNLVIGAPVPVPAPGLLLLSALPIAAARTHGWQPRSLGHFCRSLVIFASRRRAKVRPHGISRSR